MSNDAIALIGILTGAIGAAAGALGVWVARRQYTLGVTETAVAWFSDLRQWASEAIDTLAEASYASRHDDSAALRRCTHSLSALIDRGRLFFPNQEAPDLGQDEPRAFRGYRHAALDPLVAALHVLDGDVGRFDSAEAALVAMRREFVSGIQSILEPESLNRQVAELVRVAARRSGDKTLGGLLPQPDKHPGGAKALLHGEK